MERTLRIASVGTSAIMKKMQEGIRLTQGLETQVVYSRDSRRGRAFADEMGVRESCDDYEAMLARPDIDVVYLASPNRFHAEQALLALEHGKHVIVEKPAAVRVNDARAMREAAKAHGVFFFEAITTLFMPNYLAYREAFGRLGDIRGAKLCFGRYSSKYDAYLRGELPNIFNPRMDGGALNDMGVYCVHVAVDLFGRPERVRYEAETGRDGIDLAGTLYLEYPDLTCTVETAKCRDLPCGCLVEGTRGRVCQQGMVNSFENCRAWLDGEAIDLNRQEDGNRMIYELGRFRDAILSRDQVFFERMCLQSETVAWILEQAAKR